MDYKEINKEIWNKKVEEKNIWTQAVSSDEVERAKNGDFSIVVTPMLKVPRNWFPKDLQGVKILCLASGGGQQGPILAAAGADVTVYDNSPSQLAQDKLVAKRDGLVVKTVQGDMCNLQTFDNDTFDMIVHPWSNGFVASVLPVWKEAYRVLKKGGVLIAGFGNPLEYIFDLKSMYKGELLVRHSIPYSDLSSISEDELKELVLSQNEPVCFGHTLDDQIGGQLDAGFVISGFYEDVASMDILQKYIKGSIATKAVKL